MIALDTEATGLDLRHGATPFFLTICEEGKEPCFWEWDVNPFTREVDIPEGDKKAIRLLLSFNPEVIMHNSKYDVTALYVSGIIKNWNWEQTKDSLLAGHLLASNQPHNLTDMAIHYLGNAGMRMEKFELRLGGACKEARKIAKARFPDWMTACHGLPTMPSIKKSSTKDDKLWKNDMWLPRALASKLNYPKAHPWWTVLRDYSNADSEATMLLWPILRDEIERRGLWEIYETRLKLLPIVWDIENSGFSLSGTRLRENVEEFQRISAEKGAVCVEIARGYDYPLELPKGAVNNSLREFCFDYLKLEKVYNSKAKSDNPTLDAKNAIPHYLATLPQNSKQRLFITSLNSKRIMDTALTFMESYERFWIPLGAPEDEFYLLHSQLNITGSDTLRFSCQNPNAQQIGKREEANIRYCFGPAPGREWWSLDAKNIELRLPAYLSEEEELIELFERPNDHPYYGSQHLLNFSVVYPDLWDAELKIVGLKKVGPFCKKKYAATWYQWCKNGDFAIQYNCGRETADRSFHRVGSYDRLKSKFYKLEALNQRCMRFAKEHGYVETILDRSIGCERGYPLMCARTERGEILSTVPLNYHIQGSAMWWMSKAMIRCSDKLKEWSKAGFDGKIVMQVHDELVFDFPKKGEPVKDGEIEKKQGKAPLFRTSNLWRIRTLQGLMAMGGDDLGNIPTPTSAEFHPNNWSEGISL